MLFLDASDIDAAKRAMCELAVVFLMHPLEAKDESERLDRQMIEDANQRTRETELSLPGTSIYHKCVNVTLKISRSGHNRCMDVGARDNEGGQTSYDKL